ncbi:hypothetical protein TNCV_4592391 [Trichonephila clavipes]|nr:hypothetical protein TNCV_4592391 [Trichonephila clavipes]
MQRETIINGNGVTIKNKPTCTEEVFTLSILPINLPPDDIEINISPDIPQIFESKNKTITPNFMPVKKYGLHVKDDQRIVVPESVSKEVKRRAHVKRRPRIKENKDYYFISMHRQKIENSVADCDHCVFVNHKRRKKEDVPLKTYYTDHLGPQRITNFDEGVMEQTVQFEQDLQ